MLDLKAIFGDAPAAPPMPAESRESRVESQEPAPAAVSAVDHPAPAAGGGQLPLLRDSPTPGGAFADWGPSPDTRGRIGLQAPCAPVPSLAWEDLRLPDAPLPPGPPLEEGPCWWCRHQVWWRSVHGAVVCGCCHPPAPGLAVEWFGGDGR